MTNTAPAVAVETYRIGFWPHRWWPTAGLLRCIVTGRQLTRRADTGSRYLGWPGRVAFIKTAAARLKLIRRPGLPWQAEVEGLRFCRRALTADGATKKILGDVALALGEVTGYPIDSPWQLHRTARANARAIRKAKRA